MKNRMSIVSETKVDEDENSKPGPELDRAKRNNGSRFWQLLVILFGAELLIFQYYPGLGLALFLMILLVAVAVRYRAAASQFLVVSAVCAILLLVESADYLTILLALGIIGLFALARSGGLPATDWQIWRQFFRAFITGPFSAVPEIGASARMALRGPEGGNQWRKRSREWLAPASLAIVFVALFLPANPWLVASLRFLSPLQWLSLPSPMTITLWCIFALAIWPLLNLDTLRVSEPNVPTTVAGSFGRPLFSSDKTVPVLALFNAIFLLQTTSDLANLWPAAIIGQSSSVLLPHGMSYSAFARAGAYPLLIAALLAAAIILLALRENGEPSHERIVPLLILGWIAQTLLLVGSAAIRLDLYVDAYGLTRLRLFTFVGMGLIVSGLLLTTARLIRARSNAWLVRMNMIVLGAVLFGCGMANLDGFIARQNIEPDNRTSLELHYARIDTYYLCGLGIDALPQIFVLLKQRQLNAHKQARLRACYQSLHARLMARQDNWRSWSWRGSRMLDQLPTSLPIRSTYDKQPL